MRNSINGIVPALQGLCLLLVIWQIAAWLLDMAILPGPAVVLPIFFRLLPGELGRHFLASALRVLAAIGLAAALALPAGLGLGLSPRLNRLFDPFIAVLYPIPKIVFLPVVFVLLGVGDVAKVALIAFILFFQILVMVRDEALKIPRELILSVRSLGAGRRALARFVHLPAGIPGLLTALRVSVGIAVAVLFITEQSLTRWGLGYYIVVEAYQVLRYPEMYAGILAMGLLGLLLYAGIAGLEFWLLPHRRGGESKMEEIR